MEGEKKGEIQTCKWNKKRISTKHKPKIKTKNTKLSSVVFRRSARRNDLGNPVGPRQDAVPRDCSYELMRWYHLNVAPQISEIGGIADKRSMDISGVERSLIMMHLDLRTFEILDLKIFMFQTLNFDSDSSNDSLSRLRDGLPDILFLCDCALHTRLIHLHASA